MNEFLVSHEVFFVCQKCLEVLPDDIPSKLYFDRCTELMKKSESELVDWTDVHILTEKY
jgi:hypothetical protein